MDDPSYYISHGRKHGRPLWMQGRVRSLGCSKMVSVGVPQVILHMIGAKVTAVLKPQITGIIHTHTHLQRTSCWKYVEGTSCIKAHLSSLYSQFFNIHELRYLKLRILYFPGYSFLVNVKNFCFSIASRSSQRRQRQDGFQFVRSAFYSQYNTV